MSADLTQTEKETIADAILIFPPPKCDKCGFGLTEPGGLAFSPPETVEHSASVSKYHLCVTCWAQFVGWVEYRQPPITPMSGGES